jgi:hypothetical protein
MLRRRWLGAVALLVSAVVIALMIAEGGVRLFYARWDFEPAAWVNHAVLGYVYRPQHRFVHPTNEEYQGAFLTDDAGLIIRASLDRTPADRAVLFLGDSMLDGQGVAPDENLSEVVARALAREGTTCRCANAGMSASSPVRHLLAYREYRTRVRPDAVVVLVYVLNDFNDDARLFHDDRLVVEADGNPLRIKPMFDCWRGTGWRLDVGTQPMPRRQPLGDCGGPQTYQLAVRTWAAHFAVLGPRFGVLRSAAFATRATAPIRDNLLAIFKAEADLAAVDRADIARTIGWLHRLVDEVRADGATPLIVVVPFAGQVPGGLAGVAHAYDLPEGMVVGDMPQRLLRASLGARGIAAVDLLPLIRAEGADRIFGRRDKHFSTEGHRIVGTALAKHLSASPPPSHRR